MSAERCPQNSPFNPHTMSATKGKKRRRTRTSLKAGGASHTSWLRAQIVPTASFLFLSHDHRSSRKASMARERWGRWATIIAHSPEEAALPPTLQAGPPRGGEVAGGAWWWPRGRLEPVPVEAMCCHTRRGWDRREREREREEREQSFHLSHEWRSGERIETVLKEAPDRSFKSHPYGEASWRDGSACVAWAIEDECRPRRGRGPHVGAFNYLSVTLFDPGRELDNRTAEKEEILKMLLLLSLYRIWASTVIFQTRILSPPPNFVDCSTNK
jgi:hypothetical protein